MRIVIDIEANGLNPTDIWVIVAKDLDTGELHVFREPSNLPEEKEKFLQFCQGVSHYVGHNWLGYDYPVLRKLLCFESDDIVSVSTDTLVVSKLVNYSRPQGHSLEDYGLEFGLEKEKFSDFTKYSTSLEERCIRDVEINHKVYLLYLNILSDPVWQASIRLEQEFQLIVNALHDNGFAFNVKKANSLLERVKSELEVLDVEIRRSFPPKLQMVREVHPRLTRYGTLNKGDFRWVKDGDLSEYNGGPFCKCEWKPFNPASHRQIIVVLSEAGWSPYDKTTTHIQTEREINRHKYNKQVVNQLDLTSLHVKMVQLGKFGWKINENNLQTLPDTAPQPARSLAKRILLESRRRTLTEWLALVPEDGRIHGQFYGIGAWTHRMAHQRPNTANIPTDVKLFGKEMRALWHAPRKRLLVGVDAEGIQLRIFAHYINDKQFTEALVNGKKSDKTDPHSLNKSIIGAVCKSRQDAKRFIFAYLLGAGVGKLAQILGCSREEGNEALSSLLKRYSGLDKLRSDIIPRDAKRGYFEGLDGRKVPIPGDTRRDREHLCMSGYLQNGEVIVMKAATVKWSKELQNVQEQVRTSSRHLDTRQTRDSVFIVNLVHDEWQTETPNDMAIALRVAECQSRALREVGEELKLNCPMAGSYWNEDIKDYTIGTNWSVTH